ncbi:MAG: peptidoglycan-binding protein [Polyangiaceae bacterium]|nr:peptidoglycan-binding protein [Polyangiaceae bacterium]
MTRGWRIHTPYGEHELCLASGLPIGSTVADSATTEQLWRTCEWEVESLDPEVLVAVLLLDRELGAGPVSLTGGPEDRFAVHRVIQRLKHAVAAGTLVFAKVTQTRASLSVVPGVPALPPPPPAPAPPEERTSWFEVLVVDEIGEPIDGVEVVLRQGESELTQTTDGSGKARWEELPGSFASVSFGDVSQLRDILHARWQQIREGMLPDVPDLEVQPLREAMERVAVTCEEPKTIAVVPRVACVRLIGMYFDLGKCFLLPNAMAGLVRVKELTAGYPNATLLVVGHTDTKFTPPNGEEYQARLSRERAEAVAAFLKDDVESWYKWYEFDSWSQKHWDAPEDRHMLRSLPVGSSEEDRFLRDGVAIATAVQDFQRADGGLEVDGVVGPNTRRALIRDYMNHDDTSLPPSVATETHGAGWFFLDLQTPPNTEEERNRRVEIFLFDGPVLPPCPGPYATDGEPEYWEWRRRAQTTYDFSKDGAQLWSIRLRLHDALRRQMPNTWCRVSGTGWSQVEMSDGEGWVDFDVPQPPNQLRVQWGAADASGVHPYELTADFNLDAGADREQQAVKLRNLGYPNTNDVEFERAARAFQHDYGLDDEGLSADGLLPDGTLQELAAIYGDRSCDAAGSPRDPLRWPILGEQIEPA